MKLDDLPIRPTLRNHEGHTSGSAECGPVAHTSESVNAFAHFSKTCSVSSFGPAIEADESRKSTAAADAMRACFSPATKVLSSLPMALALPYERKDSARPLAAQYYATSA
jgi:hypothetical protein